MSNPDQAKRPINAARFDYSYEYPFSTEHLLETSREALRANGTHWSCGACHRRVEVTETLHPTQCQNENCEIKWKAIIVGANADKLPTGYDYLPTLNRSVVGRENTRHNANMLPPNSLRLGNALLRIVNVTLPDDTATEDEVASIENC